MQKPVGLKKEYSVLLEVLLNPRNFLSKPHSVLTVPSFYLEVAGLTFLQGIHKMSTCP